MNILDQYRSQQAAVQNYYDHFRSLGYTEEHNFPDEYILLVNPKNMAKVRIYYHTNLIEEY